MARGFDVETEAGAMRDNNLALMGRIWPANQFHRTPNWDYPEPMVEAVERNPKMTKIIVDGLREAVRARGPELSGRPRVVFDDYNIATLTAWVRLFPRLQILHITEGDRQLAAQRLYEEFRRKIHHVSGARLDDDGTVRLEGGRPAAQMHIFNLFKSAYQGPRPRFTARCSTKRGARVLLELQDSIVRNFGDVYGRNKVIGVSSENVLANGNAIADFITANMEA